MKSIALNLIDLLPQNVWASRAIVGAILLLALFALIRLGSCVSELFMTESVETSDPIRTSSEQSSDQTLAVTGVPSPWTEDEIFSTGDEALDQMIKSICDENSRIDLSASDNAYNTYLVVSQSDFVERDNNQYPLGPTWDIEYAKQYFAENNTGNCYNYVAVTKFILQYFGYSDAEAQPCVVELQSGNWGDHGLVFVTNIETGEYCLVDDALGANGWMLPYDEYSYDIRNIGQSITVESTAHALSNNDGSNPWPNAS